jgi:glycosyltransferase involved in cell wall biosynthesis
MRDGMDRLPMQVLLVGDASSPHIQRLTIALANADVRTVVAAFELGGLPVPEIRLGDLPVAADRRYFIAVPRLINAIRRLRPSVVHAHYLSSYGLLAAIAVKSMSKANRPPLVQSVWGTDILVTATSWLRRSAAAYALRAADVVTGDSAELEVQSRLIAGKLRWHRFVFGPPAALLTEERQRQRIFVSSRSLVPAMRVPDILEAFLVARDSPELAGFRLVICGDGPGSSALALRVHPNVEYRGPLLQRELHELLLTSNSFVSIPRTDGTSASLLEAMAAGNIPIVNRLPANLEWVGPQIGELVSRDPSTTELATAMVRAVTRPIDRQAIRSAVGGVTWETEVASLISLYSELRSPMVGQGPPSEATRTPEA